MLCTCTCAACCARGTAAAAVSGIYNAIGLLSSCHLFLQSCQLLLYAACPRSPVICSCSLARCSSTLPARPAVGLPVICSCSLASCSSTLPARGLLSSVPAVLPVAPLRCLPAVSCHLFLQSCPLLLHAACPPRCWSPCHLFLQSCPLLLHAACLRSPVAITSCS